MRVDLLPRGKNFYKANLHCHTTLSDGCFTPEEVKRLYKANGYSIVAYTDHEFCFAHPELADEDFLPITSYEMQLLDDNGDHTNFVNGYRKMMHINFYAKDPKNTTLVYFSPREMRYIIKDAPFPPLKYAGEPVEKRPLSVEGVNAIIASAKEQGFIACLNHPTWSLNDREDYCGLKGLFALEIFNSECNSGIYDSSYCPYIYDEMIRDGQRIGCVMADDNHNSNTEGQPGYYATGGFTMIAAERLEYGLILDAMEKGEFYASRGPVIHEAWFEDGYFHIKCSPVKKIALSNCGRRNKRFSVRYGGDGPLTYASFDFREDIDHVIRFTVTDENGLSANTRAYWKDEFLPEK